MQNCICQISTRGSAECGRRSRPERQRVGEVFLGRVSEPSLHQLGGLEERYKLPHRGPGQSPENVEFSAFLDLKIASRQCKMMSYAQVFAHIGHKK